MTHVLALSGPPVQMCICCLRFNKESLVFNWGWFDQLTCWEAVKPLGRG